jgi:hypothetical protein
MSKRNEHKLENGIELKFCSGCSAWVPLSGFGKNSEQWDGLSNQCKDCRRKREAVLRSKNKDVIRLRSLKYAKSEKGIQKKKEYWLEKKQEITKKLKEKQNQDKQGYLNKLREYRIKNRDAMRLAKKRWYASLSKEKKDIIHSKLKQYYLKTKDAQREPRREYSRKNKKKLYEKYMQRKWSYPVIRVKTNLRVRLWEMLKKVKKGFYKEKLNTMLGCSSKFLKQHLESQFAEGMTWENYGRGIGKWSVDHIIPCASFDLTIKEEQHKCFHYSNLRPLWSQENSSKGKKPLCEFSYNFQTTPTNNKGTEEVSNLISVLNAVLLKRRSTKENR